MDSSCLNQWLFKVWRCSWLQSQRPVTTRCGCLCFFTDMYSFARIVYFFKVVKLKTYLKLVCYFLLYDMVCPCKWVVTLFGLTVRTNWQVIPPCAPIYLNVSKCTCIYQAVSRLTRLKCTHIPFIYFYLNHYFLLNNNCRLFFSNHQQGTLCFFFITLLKMFEFYFKEH